MKKEIVVATAITALLSSLNADTKELNLNKLSADSTGKIIAPKKVKGKIDTNKKIGKAGGDKKFNLCGLLCAKPNGKKIGEISKISQEPKLKQDISKRP
ncbi:hypothetical protein MNB_SV-14-1240 [hydrothermal vent metagenome]|uniref:Uncharacterized protein n=1 Tax=hydrothermal vent metagenome TaxID=652676 RepID=A0A1W1CFJ3_9ZZZZ